MAIELDNHILCVTNLTLTTKGQAMRQEIREALDLCRKLIQESREIRTTKEGHTLSYECKNGPFTIVSNRNGIVNEKGCKFKHEWFMSVKNAAISKSMEASSKRNKDEKALAMGVFNLLENRKREIELELEDQVNSTNLYKIIDFVYETNKQNGNTKKPGIISALADRFQIQR